MPADTFSNTLGTLIMGTGNDNNTWGINANTEVFAVLENALAGLTSYVVGGGTQDLSTSPPPAGPTGALPAVLVYSGVLGSNQIVKVPNISKHWIVQNNTIGASFSLTFTTPAGPASSPIPQGSWAWVWCDGNNNMNVGILGPFINSGIINWGVAGGTADAIQVNYNPPVTSLVDGQLFFFRAATANLTTTPTFQPNALPARTITRSGGQPLNAADIPGNFGEMILRYNLANTRYELLHTDTASVAPGSITTVMLQNGAVTYPKIQNVANGRVLGNFSGGAATVSEYGLGSFLSQAAGSINLATDTSHKGQVIGYDQSTGVPAAQLPGGLLLHVREEQAAGVGGTSVIAAAYTKRTLNAVKTNEITGASLGAPAAASQITLPAGTYWCEGTAQANGNGFGTTWVMKLRLRDVTNNATLVVGTGEVASVIATGADASNNSVVLCPTLRGRFVLSGTVTIEFQAIYSAVASAGATTGFAGEVEVYADLAIWRLAAP